MLLLDTDVTQKPPHNCTLDYVDSQCNSSVAVQAGPKAYY